jgi:hypothetical protein
MAEEIPNRPPGFAADQQDDVLGKIDQLLNRHLPKSPPADVVPVLTDTSLDDEVGASDGIPVLTDAVAGPGQSARPPLPSRLSTRNTVQIVRRMSMALDAEHARLAAQIGGDATQVRLLDRLVAELKRALPAAVRAAINDKTPGSARPGGDGQL